MHFPFIRPNWVAFVIYGEGLKGRECLRDRYPSWGRQARAQVVRVKGVKEFGSKSGSFLLLLVAIFILSGCGNNRGDRQEMPPEPIPTVTPLVEIAVISTFTPTAVPVMPDPTATEIPTSVPTPIPSQDQVRTNVQANLRAGPGVVYELAGLLEEGTEVVPVSRSANRLWLKLETGKWIFANLVSGVPTDLPVETNIPVPPPPAATATSSSPTDVPSTPTPTPTFTPVPVVGDWDRPIHRNESFLMPDGLEISVLEVIYGEDERMQSYIERRGGQSCSGCLAIELKIVNSDGNSKEYVVLEDFKLYNDSPDTDPFRQVRCESAGSLRSMEQGGTQAFVKGLSDGGQRFICFEGVETLSLNTRLAYSPVFLYVDPNTPTPTPEGSGVVYATEPNETEQEYRTGWSVYFTLFGLK